MKVLIKILFYLNIILKTISYMSIKRNIFFFWKYMENDTVKNPVTSDIYAFLLYPTNNLNKNK